MANLLFKLEDCDNYQECADIFSKLTQININDKMSEGEVKQRYFKVLKLLRQLSYKLRKVKTNIVFVDALSDVIYLFSHIYTYFTTTDSYKAFDSDEVAVRRSEISCDTKYRNRYKDVPNAFSEEQIFYKSTKEYSASYIWGQLCYWFKQTENKPDESLARNRKGTLFLPDLDSFNLEILIPKSKRQAQKTKEADFIYDKNLDKCIEDEQKVVKQENKNLSSKILISNEEEKIGIDHQSMIPGSKNHDQKPSKSKKKSKKVKETDSLNSYPFKKNGTRKYFLETLKKNFSKQWTTNSKWNFKNKQKIYGSVQFESLVKSGLNYGDQRLQYFYDVIDDLMNVDT